MITLAAVGAAVALIALVWVAVHGMSRQKTGWDTYTEAANESRTKAAGKAKGDAARVKGGPGAPRRNAEVSVVRPRTNTAASAVRPAGPAAGPGVRPHRPAAEDQGEAIAAPVTTKFPAATHNPLGDNGPGADSGGQLRRSAPRGRPPGRPTPASARRGLRLRRRTARSAHTSLA